MIDPDCRCAFQSIDVYSDLCLPGPGDRRHRRRGCQMYGVDVEVTVQVRMERSRSSRLEALLIVVIALVGILAATALALPGLMS